MLMITGALAGAPNVGGIILRDLALHYGPEHILGAAIVDHRYVAKNDPSSKLMDSRLYLSRYVSAARRGKGRLAAAMADLRLPFGFHSEAKSLAKRITKDACLNGVTVVFAVLNGALTMTVARRVADQLGVPMVSLVWDPPDYVLREAGFSRYSRLWLVREFERSLARCRRVAVVSEPMRSAYSQLTAAPIHLLRHGRVMVPLPAHDGETKSLANYWNIGFAGSMYANDAWTALLRALDAVDWQLAGRKVRLRILSSHATMRSHASACIEFLGFRPDAEVDRVLADCDLNYLPQPFRPELRELCQYSFPTKLAAYLGSGKPVLVHCPAGSALASYFSANPFGAICQSLSADSIIATLESLLSDSTSYKRACHQAALLARQHFDVAVFRAAIDSLFEPSGLNSAPAAVGAS
jgi:glycosyltransferase involved in cell wall biosynthesis